MSLVQGNQSVGEYAARFEELARYYSPYATAGNDGSKCVKFKSGLRPEIKQGVVVLEVQDFGALVHKCREYEDVYNERVSSFKSKKQLPQGKGKQRLAPTGKGFKHGGARKPGFLLVNHPEEVLMHRKL